MISKLNFRFSVIKTEKVINFVALLASFGLGQGSLFLANSYLMLEHRHELVSSFGAAYALITFLLFITDWGGAVYMARLAALHDGRREELDLGFLELCLIRAAVAIVLIVGSVAYFSRDGTEFSAGFFPFASLGLIAYAFNAGGVLDGSGKAGLSGLCQAIPPVSMAVLLWFVAGPVDAAAGRMLGLAYALGLLASVMGQLMLYRPMFKTAFRSLSFCGVFVCGRTAAVYMATPLPGQALFRFQVFLATSYLTTALAAIFIYSRQLIGVGYQLIGFLLRVDIRDFALRVRGATLSWFDCMTQSLTAKAGVAAMACCLIIGGVMTKWASHEIGIVLLLYAPCLLSLAISTTLQRAFVFQSRANEVLAAIVITTWAPALAALIWPKQISIAMIVAIEIAGQLLQIVWYCARWNAHNHCKGKVNG